MKNELRITVSSDLEESDLRAIGDIMELLTPVQMYKVFSTLDQFTLCSIKTAVDVSVEDIQKVVEHE